MSKSIERREQAVNGLWNRVVIECDGSALDPALLRGLIYGDHPVVLLKGLLPREVIDVYKERLLTLRDSASVTQYANGSLTLIGIFLIKFWWIKVIGSLYLAYLVWKHFREPEETTEAHAVKKDSLLVRTFGIFWSTVISVELLDLAFSVDSILAALAVSEKVWILLLGGMLGILMMRTVARLFLTLIDKVPELENTAYILIGIISAKMMASVFGFELSHVAFFSIIIVAFIITFIIHYLNQKRSKQHSTETVEDKKDIL